MLGALNAIEKNHPTEPHEYLAFVGVAPERQGRGIGSMVMKPILDRCEAEGIPAYLEASSVRSRALYERHGFSVTEEVSIGKGAPPVWRMWRAGDGYNVARNSSKRRVDLVGVLLLDPVPGALDHVLGAQVGHPLAHPLGRHELANRILAAGQEHRRDG